MRLTSVMTAGAIVMLAMAGCGGRSGNSITYVDSSPPGYAVLVHWVPGHSGKVSGTVTSATLYGPSHHSLHLRTGQYPFSGTVSGGHVTLRFRRVPSPPNVVIGTLRSGRLSLAFVPLPWPGGNPVPFAGRRASVVAYNAGVAALRRAARRADS